MCDPKICGENQRSPTCPSFVHQPARSISELFGNIDLREFHPLSQLVDWYWNVEELTQRFPSILGIELKQLIARYDFVYVLVVAVVDLQPIGRFRHIDTV